MLQQRLVYATTSSTCCSARYSCYRYLALLANFGYSSFDRLVTPDETEEDVIGFTMSRIFHDGDLRLRVIVFNSVSELIRTNHPSIQGTGSELLKRVHLLSLTVGRQSGNEETELTKFHSSGR
jgi:hypothetical protein